MMVDHETGEVLDDTPRPYPNGSISEQAEFILRREKQEAKRYHYAGPYTGSNLAAALFAASDEIGDFVENDQKGQHFNEAKGTGGYASLKRLLTHTRPILRKYGILVRQGARQTYHRESNKVAFQELIAYTQLLHVPSGETTIEEMAIPYQKIDPQASMSALTYGKRATLCNILGIATGEGDDDGSKAASQVPLDGEVATPHTAKPFLSQIGKLETQDKLKQWGMDNRDTLATLPDDIAWHVREAYRVRMAELMATPEKPKATKTKE